jgi:DNA anti-recombination protein RmuC
MQLLDAMLQENVIPVSPSTLYPFIHVILVGIQNMKVVENLESLQSRLTQFETKMRTFNTAYQGIGSALDNAKSAWDTAGSRYDELTVLGGRITNALEEVEVLDSATESLPGASDEKEADAS